MENDGTISWKIRAKSDILEMPKKFMYHKQGIKKCADRECQAFA